MDQLDHLIKLITILLCKGSLRHVVKERVVEQILRDRILSIEVIKSAVEVPWHAWRVCILWATKHGLESDTIVHAR